MASRGKRKDESEEEIFEINDFTNATPWETFIADIEKILRQWGLSTSVDEASPLDPLQRQHCKTERLTYAGRNFSMKLEVSGERSESIASHASHQGGKGQGTKKGEKEAWSPAMHEMMDSHGDFPPRSHPLTRWYGVREFVLIAPEKGVESLTSQAQAKLMLSSVSIAAANTHCATPIFVQLQQQWRHLYVGVAISNGILISYNMIHLRHAPSNLSRLSGLLGMFKAKIGTPSKSLEPVHLALRFTYVLKHWSLEEWPVEPLGDILGGSGEEGVAHWKELPLGPMSDPINELHLSAVWPNLSEEIIGDYTDLQPSHAPLWTVTSHLVDNTSCFLSECLQAFLKLCYREETLDQLLKNASDESAFGSALEKLTNQSVPSLGSPFLSSMVYSASQRLEFRIRGGGGGTGIVDKDLEKILKVLFPDAYELPETPVEEDKGSRVKSAPQGSLSSQLASTLCIINNDCGLRAFAEVWNEVVQELRYRWDKGITINSLPSGSPDMGSCLLHQKLQMLNCCIQHKKSQEKLHTPNISSRTANPHSQSAKSHSHSTKSHSKQDGSFSDWNNPPPRHHTPFSDSSDSDEFYEALETHDDHEQSLEPEHVLADSSTKDANVSVSSSDAGLELASIRIGAEKQCGDLILIATGEPLCVPITQDHTPMTEDMMYEQQSVLAKLGTSEQAAKVRAKMQSSSLLSDMQAFKAANPGCLLEDFVRWYSPRDWLEGDPDTPTPGEQEGQERESQVGVAGEKKAQVGVVGEKTQVGVAEPEDTTGKEAQEGEAAEAKSEPHLSSRLDVQEEAWPEDDWNNDGWGQEDWDVVVDEAIAEETKDITLDKLEKRFVKGHMSDRMRQPDNVWVETWQSATPLPVYRQKRIFDDTKEAEKVLHFFANQKLSELAMSLMPMLLHSAVLRLQLRLKSQPLARVEGILQDALSLLATVQQPSLDSLPLYQECVGLLSQAERLLAAAHSLRGKLMTGLELEGGASSGSKRASEIAVATEMMLEGPELVLKDPLQSQVGVAMRGLLAAQMALQDLDASSRSSSSKFRQPVSPPSSHPHHHHTPSSSSFPPPTWREFILRCSSPCPTPHSHTCPQRVFCVIQPGNEFRVAGAFSTDTSVM